MNQYVSIKLPLIPRHPQPESQIRFPGSWLSLASTVSLILLLTCAGLTPFSQAATFKVALLTPGTISDVGWNALAYDGLKAVEKDVVSQKTNHIESKNLHNGKRIFAIKGLKTDHFR